MFKIPSMYIQSVASSLQPVDSTENLIMFSLNGMCLDTHLQAVDIATFCLTKLENVFFCVCGTFLTYAHTRMCDLKINTVTCQ